MPSVTIVLVCVFVAAVAAAAVGGAQPLPEPAQLPANAQMPDPLASLDGKRVTSRTQWERQRRPELKRLFEHYMYGFMPPRPRSTRATVDLSVRDAMGGQATMRLVTLRFGLDGVRPLHLLLLLPNRRTGRVATFLGISFVGNHAVIDDRRIPLAEGWMYGHNPGEAGNRATEAGRGTAADVWNAAAILSRGYALATFYNGDVEPDRPGAEEGIRAHLAGAAGRGPHDWGTIAAWAWGMQRAVDYLVSDGDVDPGRIAVVGHSRNGKASLLAAAFDERIALAIPHQAGCGGTAPSRGRVGESVKQINTSFPHWFDDTFKAFNDQPERLPVDQNCLAALMAPRPVLFSNATEDTWANPAGQFEVLRAADPVYRLLGVEGLGSSEMPPVGKLLGSRLGYYIRPGQHSMTAQDWQAFLDFADRYLAAAPGK